MNWETLMCFGDSITAGARSYLGYPEHCGHALQQRTERRWNVVNHATNGFRAIDLARSIDVHAVELQARAAGICTLMIGTNDLKTPTGGSDFEIAYSLLVLKLRLIMNSTNIILLEIPHLEDGVMFPYRKDMNDTVDRLNGTIRATGKDHGLMVERINAQPDDYFDGVHLNAAGAERWGQQLAAMILRMRYTA